MVHDMIKKYWFSFFGNMTYAKLFQGNASFRSARSVYDLYAQVEYLNKVEMTHVATNSKESDIVIHIAMLTRMVFTAQELRIQY